MTHCLLLLLIIILSSCSGSRTRGNEVSSPEESDSTFSNNAVLHDTSFVATTNVPASFLDLNESYACFKNFINPATFLEQTNIYLKPDSMSEIIESIKFNTPIKITENNGKGCDWYEIQIDDKIGYVMAHQIATHTFNSVGDNKNLQYFIVTDLKNGQINPNVESVIYKYDINRNVLIDKFEVHNFRANIIKQINSTKWKNVDLLLFFDNTHGCCGCTLEQNYLIDANGSFDKLLTSYTFLDDGGEGYGKWVSVTLADNPATDTIYYREYEYGGLYRENDEPVLDEKGNPKMDVIVDIRRYYRWDGYKLVGLTQ